MNRSTPAKSLQQFLFLLISLLAIYYDSNAQAACQKNWYPVIKQRLVPNIIISNHIRGYIEYLPPIYKSNPDKRFPLIIFIAGVGGMGNGDSASLCFVAANALPLKIEQGTYPEVVYSDSQPFSFVVISPQCNSTATKAEDIKSMI